MDDGVVRHREDRERGLYERALEQAGYFTAGQARMLGFSPGEISGAVGAGGWERVDRDLFRLSPWPHTDLEDVARQCVQLQGAVVSHQSAAELYGLGHLHPQFLHVTASAPVHVRTERVAVHRAELLPADREHTGAFLITTPLRTVLDLADGGISQWVLDEVVGDALAIGRLDRAGLEAGSVGRSVRVERRVGRALAAGA
ncbi:type IV toxin-antitoxin system AbiEi family antitoxin domain-containing protein [Rhodococcus daqingensis]|uniref:Transcriptional regulator, AbiEi antitoxin, Type IV TA system n=1 Tax=Rhodococcus daqingensis TaxID=2479363 RepID=A0ABW2S0R5_9NOCA